MNLASLLKEVARGRDNPGSLSRDQARNLYAAMLDGGVSDMELGALLVAYRIKSESEDELLGFLDATEARLGRLDVPGSVRPVVLPSYNGARRQANLTPLLALLLAQRFGIPVLVHGPLEGYGRVTSAHIFRELGVMPAVSIGQVQEALFRDRIAMAPLPTLSAGLAGLLATRARLGVRTSGHTLVKLMDPFVGAGVVVSTATHPEYLERMRTTLVARPGRTLLLRGSEGEPYANPRRRPRLDYIHDGICETLFDAEHDSLQVAPHLPGDCDAQTTAVWTRQVLAGDIPLPQPLAHQIACLLVACGLVEEVNEAKARVVVELSVHGAPA